MAGILAISKFFLGEKLFFWTKNYFWGKRKKERKKPSSKRVKRKIDWMFGYRNGEEINERVQSRVATDPWNEIFQSQSQTDLKTSHKLTISKKLLYSGTNFQYHNSSRPRMGGTYLLGGHIKCDCTQIHLRVGFNARQDKENTCKIFKIQFISSWSNLCLSADFGSLDVDHSVVLTYVQHSEHWLRTMTNDNGGILSNGKYGGLTS